MGMTGLIKNTYGVQTAILEATKFVLMLHLLLYPIISYYFKSIYTMHRLPTYVRRRPPALVSEEMFVIVCTGLTGARRRREDPSSSNVIWHWAFPAQETTDYAATSCYRYYYNYYTITTGAFFRVERRGLSPKLLVWPLPPPRQLTLESTLPISLATAAAKASSSNLLFFHARWGLIMLINVLHHDTMCFTTTLFALWKVIL